MVKAKSSYILLLDETERYKLFMPTAVQPYLKKRYLEAYAATLTINGNRVITIPCNDLCELCGTHKDECIGERLHVCTVYEINLEVSYPRKVCVACNWAGLVKHKQYPYENVPKIVKKVLDKRRGY